ncbi:MAG: CPBP family intramembrane metalloprotease, partial [Gemmatimonadetes bacterium]|nr:CPBP family intramembrane metalloprotease [Gemmatimonadota bacterium]
MSLLRLVLRSADGRLRLGWRLLLFLLIAVGVTGVLLVTLPEGIVWESLSGLVGALFAGWVLLRPDGRTAGALGFHLAPSAPRESLWGLGLGVGLAVAVVLVMVLGGAVGWRGEDGSVLGWFGTAAFAAGLLALPAAAEEALFRGYPFQAVAQSWGPVWALVLTSALFGWAHMANPGATVLGAANTGAAGVFLGVVYLKTGSLWWATGAHLGWNWGLGFLADLPVSGLELIDAPLVEATVQGPDWLAGG